MADDVGRLVKKKSLGEKGYLEIQEYPWLDFVEDGILFTDNPRKSVVHTRFHTSEEIAEKVRTPANFERPMGPKSHILIPTDLTDEYQRSQQEIFLRKRKRMLDEDELFNLELADLNGQAGEVDGAWSKRGSAAATSGESTSPSAPAPAPAPATMSETAPASPASSSGPQGNALSPIGEAKSSATERTSSYVAGEPAPGTRGEEPSAQGHAQGFEEGLAQGLAQGKAEGLARGHEEGLAQGMSEGLEQGRQTGYEEGFMDGEAKGVAAAEARTERYFSLLAQALSELETLRGEVLRAGQDIFLEIANLCCEKILRQKLGSSDEALKKLFLSAVEAYADAHRVTLEMNPSDAARMKGAFDTGVQARVVVRENPDLAPGDFRADSEKEILTVDLKRAVEGLIEGLRAELFPQDTVVESQRIASEKSRKTG